MADETVPAPTDEPKTVVVTVSRDEWERLGVRLLALEQRHRQMMKWLRQQFPADTHAFFGPPTEGV